MDNEITFIDCFYMMSLIVRTTSFSNLCHVLTKQGQIFSLLFMPLRSFLSCPSTLFDFFLSFGVHDNKTTYNFETQAVLRKPELCCSYSCCSSLALFFSQHSNEKLTPVQLVITFSPDALSVC